MLSEGIVLGRLWAWVVVCVFESCYWLMLLFGADKNRALQAAERLQAKLRERGDVANEDKLNLLKSVLQSPLFSQILNLQTSVQQLKDQVGHPSPKAGVHGMARILGKAGVVPKSWFLYVLMNS